MMHPLTILRQNLGVAARARMEYGATEKQIDMIVALSRGLGKADTEIGGNVLTKSEASRIIDQLISEGAVADYQETEGELDDDYAQKEAIANEAANRKIRKAGKRAAKKAKDKAEAEYALSLEGKRVSGKYIDLAGTVIAVDGKYVIVQPDNQAEPRKVAAVAMKEI